jgi:hypothetical protein
MTPIVVFGMINFLWILLNNIDKYNSQKYVFRSWELQFESMINNHTWMWRATNQSSLYFLINLFEEHCIIFIRTKCVFVGWVLSLDFVVKCVLIHWVLSLDFEWIYWSCWTECNTGIHWIHQSIEEGRMNCTHILLQECQFIFTRLKFERFFEFTKKY